MLDGVVVVQNSKLLSQGITDKKLMCLNCCMNLMSAARNMLLSFEIWQDNYEWLRRILEEMFLPDLRCFALNLPGGTNKNYEYFLTSQSLVLIQAGCLVNTSPYAWLFKLTLNNIHYHKLVLKFCQHFNLSMKCHVLSCVSLWTKNVCFTISTGTIVNKWMCFTIIWLCIVTDSLWIKPTDALNFNFIGITTLHVSGSLSARNM